MRSKKKGNNQTVILPKETLNTDVEGNVCDDSGPSQWVQQERSAVRTVDQLAEHFPLTPKEYKTIARACERFQMKITPYYLGLIDPDQPACPIRKMAVPDVRELKILESEFADPIGDTNPDLNNQPVPALTHRYPDRVLLYPTSLCGIYCRHCFRRRLAGKREYAATKNQMAAAIRYIEKHSEIHEVILTGGDPLMLADQALFYVLEQLQSIPHIRTLRIHTRMPVVNPFRITEELAEGLSRFTPLWLVTHFNHPVEVTETARKHLARLADRGIPLLNQGVLLKGVNDDPETLRELGWKLIEARVKPYYLHHLDRAQGVSHFRVGVRKGLRLLRELRGTMPGYAIPSYILDIPKGYGKVPLQYHYLSTDEEERIYVETPDGDYVTYADERAELPEQPQKAPSIRPLEVYPDEEELNERLAEVVESHE